MLVDLIRNYWDSHPLGTQYIDDSKIELGSPEFFAAIRPWMNPYKFPWIMTRIEREAALLKGKHLLEVGCGMGFDSLEFIKRGVRVTVTDLTPRAVELTRRHFQLENVIGEEVREANVLDLPFEENTFDAVWANGVLHATGDTPKAIREIYRVLKTGGRAIISHFYRKPSWMYFPLARSLARRRPDRLDTRAGAAGAARPGLISGDRLTSARRDAYTPRSVRVPHRSTTSMEDGKQMSQMLLYVPTIAPVGAADRGRSVPFSR